jgi:hypothetical protein
MAILGMQTAQPTGLASVTPSIIYILTSDTYATVTATGYLNNAKQEGFTFNNQQMALVYTTDDGPVWLKVAITYSGASVLNTVVSLVQLSEPGNVSLPTIANHFIVSTDTVGSLANLTGTAINGGSLQAGLSGTAGALISYPSTASKGSLILAAVANTGNTNTTISNVAMGQASVISIPDPAGATANFAIAPAALVSNNLVKASGTAGLVADAGIVATAVMQTTAVNTMSGSGQIILVKANGTESANAVTASGNAGVITTSSLSAAGGATYVITWTNTKITATSVIALTIQGGTNTTQNITFTCAPGAGSATLTIYNNTAATSLNGTILIGYSVL